MKRAHEETPREKRHALVKEFKEAGGKASTFARGHGIAPRTFRD